MKLFLVRHAQTKENKLGILQGWLPGHLSPKGKNQAKALARRLQKIHLDYIYTSDLQRSIETASPLIRDHPQAISLQDPLLRERGYGVFQGRKVKRKEWDELSGTFFTNKPKGGESLEDVWKRQKVFYKKIKQKHRDHTILIVGHDDQLRLLVGFIRHKTLEQSYKIKPWKHGEIRKMIM